jgi:hypothetical protein
MNFEDCLCDKCLYLVQNSDEPVELNNLCPRCQKKLKESLLEVVVETVDIAESLPEEPEL